MGMSPFHGGSGNRMGLRIQEGMGEMPASKLSAAGSNRSLNLLELNFVL